MAVLCSQFQGGSGAAIIVLCLVAMQILLFFAF